ncbi:MAG: SdrD B-like domain-containing protein [Caldilineaceae bacterium]
MDFVIRRINVLVSILVIWLTAAGSLTAQVQAAPAAPMDTQGIAYKIVLSGNTYEVYMRPDVTPSAPNLTLTAQVTLKAPHATGTDRFTVSDLQSTVAGAVWSTTSRMDAPTEDTAADYISFVVDFPGGNRTVYDWKADQEIKVFTFKNSGACLGAVALLNNDTDPFNQLPNSVGTNPGNQITVLGIAKDNAYIGNYGTPANCTPAANNDSDGDGVPDQIEDANTDGDNNPATNAGPDTDGDGKPNYLDIDDDGDSVLTRYEDVNNDGNWLNDDIDGDGIPNYLDDDDDNDAVPTIYEDINGDGDPTNDDTDGDFIWNMIDLDDDGDGALTINEDPNNNGDPRDDDSDGDGIPDYLDPDDFPPGDGDSDVDGVPDGAECPTGIPCRDTDGDGRPDYLDRDDDGDGINTIDEDTNQDGNPRNDDSDHDGIPNYLDNDNSLGIEFGIFYRHGLYEVYMRPNADPHAPNLTLTSQVTIKAPHAVGLSRFTVSNLVSSTPGTSWSLTSRIDGPAEDPNTDYLSFVVSFTGGDHGVYEWSAGQEVKVFTFRNTGACNGIVRLIENDSDSFNQLPNSVGTNPGNQIDVLGIERNNAYIGNYGEAEADCTILDSDGDGVPDPFEDANLDGDNNPATNPGPDTDGDGIPNYLDPDDDGDGIPTIDEDASLDGDPTNDDNDRDRIPDYLDPNDRIGGVIWLDTNGDGLRQVNEERMPDQPVLLYRLVGASSVQVMTMTTDSEGGFLTPALPHSRYYLEFVAPDGLVPTKANRGTDDSIDSDGVRTGLERNSRTAIIQTGFANALHARDGGFVVPASVEAVVFNDRNRNGVRDEGEEPIPGATVILFDSDGNEVARVVADEDGLFSFADLTPDTYQIQVIPPDGYVRVVSDLVTLPPLEPGGSLSQDLGVAQTSVPTDPKAIDLVSFTADPQDETILIRWETAAEEETQGFHIYMGSTSAFATSTRLTSYLVASQGSHGGVYELTLPYNPQYDPPLYELRFWLVELELDGKENHYGPITILTPTIYLPMVTR